MAFDRKNIQETKSSSKPLNDKSESAREKEKVNNENNLEEMSEEIENEQKRKEAMTERD